MGVRLSIVIPVYNQEKHVIRALRKLPRRDDIEILVRDDGSTDNTLENLYKYKEEHPELNLTIFANGENKGVAWTKNRLLEEAKGEWVHIHDSDDYVLTDVYDEVLNKYLGKRADIICFDLEINDMTHLLLDETTVRNHCAQIARLIRMKFIGDTRFPEHIRAGDDRYFADELLEKNPRTIFTGVAAYHYNFPRIDSLSDFQRRGIL